MAIKNTNGSTQLTVYKASAGSGKTFTLSKEYIKLLMKNPTGFRNILAVTFTNKATEEMKTRILSTLYGIWKNLPDAKDYIDAILKETGVTLETLKQNAGLALGCIVSNYSYFRIETIDSFFQSILRNLARELDLTANLKLELNDTQTEENAVDEMIEELHEDDELLLWIMGYIRERMEEDKSWKIVKEVKSFGRTIFKEFYKCNREALNNALSKKGFFENYKGNLYKIRNEAEAKMTGFANKFDDALKENGLTIGDLKSKKSGPSSYFNKLKRKVYDDTVLTGCVRNVIDNQGREGWKGWEEWAKDSDSPALKELASQVLSPLLLEAEQHRKDCWINYVSADLTLKNLNQLRLLNSIDNKVKAMNAEANRFLLSDTHTLLHSLINDSDTPFIFEKAGTQLDTIMIDEFQDTSTVQWENFKVLLEELMSHTGKGGNLIVGDVKQSIYRWRSGDWRLLNNIETLFQKDQILMETLSTNWRSERRIVEFNNAFFLSAKKKEAALLGEEYTEQLEKAYSDVEQKTPEKRGDGGYVKVQLIPAAKRKDKDRELELCLETVRTLLDKGAKQSQIAFLLRNNKEIQAIADYFSAEMPEVKMVSDEAFRLDNSLAVNIIITAMHFLSHPDDMIARAFLVKAFQTKVFKNEGFSMLLDDDMPSLLPQEFTAKRTELISLPLYELAERLYKIFGLEKIKGEDAYLFAFYDKLNDFIANGTADMDDFVKEWEENLRGKTIKTSEVDGIRLMTIHKSKGLEFDHVIVPFCDWTLENQNDNIIWCKPEVAPYNELPLVPIPFSTKKLLGTVYEKDYHEEHLQNMVDNLNLIYVAFTRASQSLFVIAQRGGKSRRSYVLEEVLKEIRLDGATLKGDPTNGKETLTFEYGSLTPKDKKEKQESRNVFLAKTDSIAVEYETYDNNTEFRQSNKSKDFLEGEDDKQKEYIKTGLLLHNLFSKIKTGKDIDSSIRQMVMDGVMNGGEDFVAGIKAMLHKRLQTPRVKEWFSDKWKVLNECDILFVNPDGETKNERPDRVMTDGKRFVVVDFKFGKPKAEYREQVNHYMTLIKEMGYDDVTGYLWYVYSNEIDEVKL